MTIPDTVAASFVETFDGSCAHDDAIRLNCEEVDALAELLTALGRPDLATIWIEAHAVDDDSGDAHHSGP